MNDSIAWLNGRLIPGSEAALPVHDLGVVAGASVTEMIRTIGGVPFLLSEHLDRLALSLELMEFATRPERDLLAAVINDVARHNHALLPAGHDLGVIVFVTAGQNLTYLGGSHRAEAARGTVCVHTFPLPFELWADRYSTGQHLATVSIPSLPTAALSPQAKHRNRLHWWRADREARSQFSDAVSVLTDSNGFLTETSAGNIMVVNDRTIRTPRSDNVLGGISRGFMEQLSRESGFDWSEADLTENDFASADEAWTSSTTSCLLPVTRFNGRAIGTGSPGPVFQQLIAEWSRQVGLDIVRQAVQAATERVASQQSSPA